MDDKPTDYDRHEALDRTHTLASMIGDLLIDHPWLVTKPELHRQVEQAQDLLLDVYQKIGIEHLDAQALIDQITPENRHPEAWPKPCPYCDGTDGVKPVGAVASMTDNPNSIEDVKTPGWKLHRCPDGEQCRASIGGGCARSWCQHFEVKPDEEGVPRFPVDVEGQKR